jgi:BirA family biotin operon repressor/biotin-[acetyl-CoA-carboxylase] ligase
MSFGAPHRHFRRVDSTNARARELAEAGAPHGTVVTADEQTAGRGRQGRTWIAPPGKALLYSAILRPLGNEHHPLRPLGERHLLPLSVPLAVCEVAEELAPGIECQIKWPNDIWIDGRKLAGILIEARTPGQDSASTRRLDRGSTQPRDGWAVIGVGLNLTITPDEFPPDLRDTAISIFGPPERGRESPRRCLAKRRPGGPSGAREAGSKSHRPEGGDGQSARRLPTPLTAAAALNRHLDRWVSSDRDIILPAWRARDALLGRQVSWDGGAGIADGIEDSGDLVVVSGDNRIVLGAGEVHLRL